MHYDISYNTASHRGVVTLWIILPESIGTHNHAPLLFCKFLKSTCIITLIEQSIIQPYGTEKSDPNDPSYQDSLV